ncbi:H(+)-transporting V1 sector ATPase subunit G, partial [Apophysomyces sp. BC1021]
INTLLEAEREAAKIVLNAKQYRVQRLKDARSEAAKDIDQLKAQKNSEYQNSVAQHSGESDQSLGKVDQETEVKIAEIKAKYSEHKETAMGQLIEAIVNVKPAPHQNVRV